MMSLKKISLLVLSLIATSALVACGEEPSDNDPIPDGGPNGTDPGGSDPGTAVDSTPIVQKSTLVGKAYILSFDVQYWTKPGGSIGEELGKYTPKFTFQFRTVDDTLGTFTAVLGTAKNGAQDICNKTYTITGSFGSSAIGATTFTTNSLDVDAIIEGPAVKTLATLRNFTIKGEFFDQGAGYKAGGITAELDGNQIFSIFTKMNPVPTSSNELCSNLFDLGVNCEACSFNAGDEHCLTVEASLFKLNATAGFVINDVGATDQTCLN